jgi:hypothetical protein
MLENVIVTAKTPHDRPGILATMCIMSTFRRRQERRETLATWGRANG